MIRAALVFIPLAAAVLLSGCTQPPGAPATGLTAAQIVGIACLTYQATAPSATIIASVADPMQAKAVSDAASYGTAFCSAPPPASLGDPAAAAQSAVWLGQQAAQVAVAVQAARAQPAN